MRIELPLCLFNRHQPVRGEVHWDGWGYRSTCRFCGKLVERESKGLWRKAEPRQPPEAPFDHSAAQTPRINRSSD